MKLRHLLNLERAYWNYYRRKTKVSNYPMVADIELTNACNFRCTFCARSVDAIGKRGYGYMTEETFGSIVNEENQPMLRHIRLFMHGESLLHPKVVDFVREGAKYARTIGFTSNGSLMTREMSRDLLEAGITSLAFSFEGTSPEAYEQVRRGGSYDTVLRNIRGFISERDEINPSCVVTVSCIDLPETHDGLEEWKRRIEGYGAIPQIIELHDWGGVAPQNPRWNEDRKTCFWPWWGICFFWDGGVVPCCVYEDPASLGNIKEQTIEEIWNGKTYRDFRRRHLEGREGLPVCETCGLASLTFVTDPYLHTYETGGWGFIKQQVKLLRAGL